MKEIRLQPCSLQWPEGPVFPESTAQPCRLKGSADPHTRCLAGGRCRHHAATYGTVHFSPPTGNLRAVLELQHSGLGMTLGSRTCPVLASSVISFVNLEVEIDLFGFRSSVMKLGL